MKIRSADNTVSKARWCMVLVAICYSTMGAAFKFVDWHPLIITAGRNLVAFCVLAAARGSVRISFRKEIVIGALISYLTSTSFVIANKLTTAANAIVLQYTNPAFVLLFSCLFLKKPFRKKDLIMVLCMIGGITLFFVDDLGAGGMLGNLFALLSGIGMACSIMYACYSGVDMREYTMLMCLISVVIGAVTAFFVPPVFTVGSVAAVVFLGVVGIGISGILYAKGAPKLPSVEVSILLMLDPILNPIWVALLVGEIPGLFSLLGALVVIGGMIVSTLLSSEAGNEEKSKE